MVKVIYEQMSDGSRVEAEGEAGDSVMQTAQANDVDGIVAECGGSAMCATCHVVVDDVWAPRLPEMDANEDAMLDSVAGERMPTSRLSCQIPLTADLDGLLVRVPEVQA